MRYFVHHTITGKISSTHNSLAVAKLNCKDHETVTESEIVCKNVLKNRVWDGEVLVNNTYTERPIRIIEDPRDAKIADLEARLLALESQRN